MGLRKDLTKNLRNLLKRKPKKKVSNEFFQEKKSVDPRPQLTFKIPLPRTKFKIPYLLKVKRFFASILFIINLVTGLVSIQSYWIGGVSFLLTSYFLLEYIWKTRKKVWSM